MSAWDSLRKTCTGCHRTLQLTEFHKDKEHRLGRRNDCKTCRRAKQRAAYRRNRECILASNRAYRKAHWADVLAWQRIRRRLAKIVGNSH